MKITFLLSPFNGRFKSFLMLVLAIYCQLIVGYSDNTVGYYQRFSFNRFTADDFVLVGAASD